MRSKVCLVLMALIVSSTVFAQDRPTYQSLWDKISKSPDCTPKDFSDLIIFTCSSTQSLWYFTKPDHPAHPGVIKRYVTEASGGVGIAEVGWSFAPDSGQPAFKTFLAQIRALDQQTKEAMAAQHGTLAYDSSSVHIEGNWQPGSGDNEAIISLTRYYFSLEDGGQYDDAYALFDSNLAAQMPFDKFKDLSDHVAQSVGHVKARSIKVIDWENSPPSGPTGLFAAVDYTAENEKGQLCGYVVWRKQPDGFYILVREETNILPATLTPEQVASMKAQFHCVS